jgi:hypothetical protein
MSRLEMSKTIIADIGAEYDPDHNTLKLDKPLEGVKGRVRLRIETESEATAEPERPWMKYHGCLSEEAGRELAKAIREAFGRDEIEI